MSSISDRDAEIRSSILRNLTTVAVDCEALAAGYSADNLTDDAVYMHTAALRYRQLAARAIGNWADADQLTALTANAARDSAWDAETAACAARDTEEIPRVHS